MLALYLSVLDDRNFEEDFTEVYNTYKRLVYHTAYKIMDTREIKILCRSYILHFGLDQCTDLIQTAGMMWLKQTNMERLHLQQ